MYMCILKCILYMYIFYFFNCFLYYTIHKIINRILFRICKVSLKVYQLVNIKTYFLNRDIV